VIAESCLGVGFEKSRQAVIEEINRAIGFGELSPLPVDPVSRHNRAQGVNWLPHASAPKIELGSRREEEISMNHHSRRNQATDGETVKIRA
jgi:hypothetical protein